MNQKKFKRSLVVVVILLMITSLLAAGCATEGTEATEQTQPSDSAAVQSSEEESQGTEASAASDGSVDLDALVAEASQLSGLEALEYWESLGDKGLSDQQIMQFFIDLPVSQANQEVYDLYINDGLDIGADSYPIGEFYDNFEWQMGMGTEIVGAYTGNEIKLPFTDYVPVPDGPIGDPDTTYEIGVVTFGNVSAWAGNWLDSMQWEADKHPNINLTVMDYQLDMNLFAQQMDTLIAQQVDAILIWPLTEAPAGPPVQRAQEAGIPVITSDRITGYADMACRITGNFPANGAQNGMYLVWKLAQESNGTEVAGNVVLIRKPAGSTADIIRTGYFLKVISYFPDIHVLQSYYDNDTRQVAFTNCQTALAAYDDIDAFFTGGGEQAAAAVQAVEDADRLYSREGGEKMILLSIDDSKECFYYLDEGIIDMNTPYVPTIEDIAVRCAIKIIEGEEIPVDIATPNIAMVTLNGDTIFGLQTQTYDQWYPYTYGPPYEAEASASQ